MIRRLQIIIQEWHIMMNDFAYNNFLNYFILSNLKFLHKPIQQKLINLFIFNEKDRSLIIYINLLIFINASFILY